MTPDIHAQNRAWAFVALDQLQAFLDDPDFEGSEREERDALERSRKRLKEAKYRVVFLGAFNVGKSTLINAYLGDEYLPRVLQECTTKISHVVHGDQLRAVLPLQEAATDDELDALRGFIHASGADAEVSRDGHNVFVDYDGASAGDLRNVLNALITMSSEEDFPRLKTLREKFDEVVVVLPNGRLPEDVDLVDSPGVHSVSETRSKMAEEIIPSSQLVVYLLDAQSAGNEQSREFVQGLVRHGKKVFFVLNKADQLNPEEIDPLGHCGPARDLLRSLSGIVEKPEVFFVSSLYALLAEQIYAGKLTLEDIDRNNKVKIPFSMQTEILTVDDPAHAVADYLMEESNFGKLKERILDYLFAEDKEGAVVYNTAEMVADKSWRYSRPMESRIEMAENVPKLLELRREREQLSDTLEHNRATLRNALDEYAMLAGGGSADGAVYEGYEALVDRRLNDEAVQLEVVRPLRNNLEERAAFKQAKKHRFRAVAQDLERRMEELLERLTREVNEEADAAEMRIRERIAGVVSNAHQLGSRAVEVPHSSVSTPRAGLAGSYFAFAVIGALVGAAGGAFVGAMTHLDVFLQDSLSITLPPDLTSLPQPGGVIGAAVGAVLGFFIGLVARASGADDARRERLDAWLNAQSHQVLVDEAREQLRSGAQRRRDEFADAVQQAFGEINGDLEKQIADLQSEEDGLASTQREIIERLSPKVAELQELGATARTVATERRLPDGVVVEETEVEEDEEDLPEIQEFIEPDEDTEIEPEDETETQPAATE
jgi:GTP-binding protein EngB required for normal cell division